MQYISNRHLKVLLALLIVCILAVTVFVWSDDNTQTTYTSISYPITETRTDNVDESTQRKVEQLSDVQRYELEECLTYSDSFNGREHTYKIDDSIDCTYYSSEIPGLFPPLD